MHMMGMLIAAMSQGSNERDLFMATALHGNQPVHLTAAGSPLLSSRARIHASCMLSVPLTQHMDGHDCGEKIPPLPPCTG
jgi:hypothetical protein